MIKFIDYLSKGDKIHFTKQNRNRPRKCAHKNNCYPLCSTVNDKTGLGDCEGLRYKARDLDCIGFCSFSISLDKKDTVSIGEIQMTPDEALDTATGLMMVVDCALFHNKSYRAAHRSVTRKYSKKRTK